MSARRESIGASITAADISFGHARWADGYSTLADAIRRSRDPIDAARCRLAVVHGQNLEDFKRGLSPERDKHVLLDIVDSVEGLPPVLAGVSAYERGVVLHIEFIMATGDLEREERCFSQAIELLREFGSIEATALALAMLGVFHHVDRLDRATAEPYLREAYELVQAGPSFAKSEAARHLGQIKQELGDLEEGLEILEESLRLREELGFPIHFPSAMHAVASAQLDLGRLDDAREMLADARRVAEDIDATFTLALITRTEADLRIAELVPGVAGG